MLGMDLVKVVLLTVTLGGNSLLEMYANFAHPDLPLSI